MSNLRSQKARARGPALSANHQRKLAIAKRHRALRLENLEPRAMLYAYPFGAMPDDTGEFMLGDVAVNVVLMESDPTLAPYDNNPLNHPTNPGIGAEIENWDGAGSAINSIANVKNNVLASLQWWKDTLVNMFPNAPTNLLNFHINWQYTDNPVPTGYEPIARTSNEFVDEQPGTGWLYDFLDLVDFNTTGNFSSDIRAFNDYSRQQANTDWAFTIFVVNNANDDDKFFASGGAFDQAFSFAGGRFMIVPASRPAKTFAHETGHQFWALDQYSSGGSYDNERGYYNTPNLNAADNPQQGFQQAPSIMTNDPLMANSYTNHTLDVYAMGQLGWQDTDTAYGEADNGIFDVLDVPFSLSGLGTYNAATGNYEFRGSTSVNTLPNLNSSGTKNDITINQIRVVEAQIDGGPWQPVATFPARTYATSVNVDIPIGQGSHEIKIRSADTRTRVKSNEFVGYTDEPVQDSNSGVSGVVFLDLNSNASWDPGEPLEPDVGLEVTDTSNEPLSLMHLIEPSDDDYFEGQNISSVDPDATLSVIGADPGDGGVYARTSTILPPGSNNRVFTGKSNSGLALNTFSSVRRLKVQFASPVSFVSLRAFGATSANSSYARLEAYTADGVLVQRFTTGALSRAASTEMTVSRATGDIDHVIAYGHLGTTVVLDTLRWGPAASATTNLDGVYSIGYLPDGAYRVHLSPPAGYVLTTPQAGYANITVAGGQNSGSVNFGISTSGAFHRFHNQSNGLNVDNDSGNYIAANDALIIINFLNAFGSSEGEISPDLNPDLIGYIDVNNDGYCAANDALDVINYLNAFGAGNGGPGGEGENNGGGPPPAGSFPGGGGGDGNEGEGEGQIIVPQNAADYFAQREMPFLQLPDDDKPCSCARCIGSATDQIMQEKSQIVAQSSVSSWQRRPSPAFAAKKLVLEIPDDTDSQIDEAIDEIVGELSSPDDSAR